MHLDIHLRLVADYYDSRLQIVSYLLELLLLY
jgi:hypothetical protein